jgi:threonine dehydrogenase-like Zn-dependent dehydrogenase
MAVAKALGARRILAVDIQPRRLEFAKDYAATDVHVASPKLPGEANMAYSKRHVSDWSCSGRQVHCLSYQTLTLAAGSGNHGQVWLRRAW